MFISTPSQNTTKVYVMEPVFFLKKSRHKLQGQSTKKEDKSRKLMSTKFYHLETDEIAVTKQTREAKT